MKTITTTGPVPKADSSLDATLNPVELSSKEVVSWADSLSQARSEHAPVTRVWVSTPSPTVGIVPS